MGNHLVKLVFKKKQGEIKLKLKTFSTSLLYFLPKQIREVMKETADLCLEERLGTHHSQQQ